MALPVAVAVWALVGSASSRERSRAQTRLEGTLETAVTAYGRALGDAEQRAAALASSPRVQRALAHRDRRRLARLGGRDVAYTFGAAAAPHTTRAATRTVTVAARNRTLGRVTVEVPFDGRLLAKLGHAVRLSGDQRLGFASGQILSLGATRVDAGRNLGANRLADLTVGGKRYRALATPLGAGPHATKLVVIAPASAFSAGVITTRWRIVAVGFSVLVAILLVAYALAPAIARNRVAKQQRDQAARVLSNVGDGVFLIDSDGIVRFWNAAAEAITGLAADDVCGRPAEIALTGWRDVAPLVPIASRPGDSDGISRAETIPLDIGGRELWLSIAGVGFTDGTVYAFRDVTNEHRLEAMRTEFVATVSHELRTPLASLHGAAVTLREHHDRLGSDIKLELLEMIDEQSRRLAELVEEILLTGQLDAGSLRVESEPFDPGELVRAAVDEARHRLPDSTTIQVSAPAHLPNVVGDGGRAQQVLANLIDNAIKYSPGGGRIDVEVDAEEDVIHFSVRDEGLGIPPGEQERIFDKFYRLDPDHRRGVSGSGLGLYICRELIRSMNGRIWVESTPGRGATFTFELPVAERVLAEA